MTALYTTVATFSRDAPARCGPFADERRVGVGDVGGRETLIRPPGQWGFQPYLPQILSYSPRSGVLLLSCASSSTRAINICRPSKTVFCQIFDGQQCSVHGIALKP